MNKLKLTTIFVFLTSVSLYGQINQSLSHLIDSLATEDQKWRGLMRQVDNKEIDTIRRQQVNRIINETDSINFFAVRQIFKRYGYPGYDKVGEESSNQFWLLVQHADKHPEFQDSVLNKMKTEAEKKNASLPNYAYLVDRVKVNTNQLQIYGTQMKINSAGTSYEPKPVFEPEKLNERRKLVGLTTIEDYVNTMNERYYGTLK